MTRHRADREGRLYLHVSSRNVQRIIALLSSLDRIIGNFVPAHQHPGGGRAGTLPIELISVLPSILQPPIPAVEVGGQRVFQGVGGVPDLCRHCETG